MSQFDYARPGGAWGNDVAPGAGDYQRWDVTQSKAVNGDDGGAYAPAAPIVIGGQGVTTSAGSTCTGGALTKTAGRIAMAQGVPRFSATRGRRILVPVLGNSYSFPGGASPGIPAPPTISDTGSGILGATTGNLQIQIPRRYLHVGARLATISLVYVCTKRPTTLPTNSMVMVPAGTDDSSGTIASTFGPSPLFSAATWSSGHAYALNSYVVPSGSANNTGLMMQATAVAGTGTSGGSQPAWPTAVGGTVVDNVGPNQITWTAVSRSGWLALKGQTLDTYFGAGQPQTLSADYLGTSGALYDNVVNVGRRYALYVQAIDPLFLVTGLELIYDSIPDLSFP